ncbi:hypothetical protein BC939DRAFT_508744 [Gamsiella multidivaricata]|uniref:uncharacterized protein n=1 Tax=Gamsiella multidivaricata TaxID=101098 RepID=UPI0022203937|nr:uncharacterized protein BC939DRAFT_508744 [Gamsiella multidivaricata]KAG0369169.1 hypothetical protein BGZ54_000159 [Gamsiella multidivaricata]KAI7815980.1 hypothetical protein BC939DRAFT_508744 [Gamsiella multidivaricata]
MSNLKTILDRLVKENLHGPINRGAQEGLKHNAHKEAQESHAETAGENDMDAHDPRWRQLFHEFFLSEHSDDRNDDLLFFVQRVSMEVQNGGLGVDPVFVKRKVKGGGYDNSVGGHNILAPEQEAVVLWKDTFFLNVIVQLPCKLTVAVCSRVAETNPITGITKTSMTCTRKYVSKRVYALPTKSRVDVKEATVECSWPLIYYVIDDYEDTFEQLMVRDSEYLCVELAVTLPTSTAKTITPGLPSNTQQYHQRSRAYHQESHWSQPPGNDGLQVGKPFPATSGRGGVGGAGGNKITLFQGAAGYQNLLGIYQQKAASKVGRRFKFGPHTVPTEFVMMRGPGGRGHAQVAITASNVRDDPLLSYSDTGSPPISTPSSPVRDSRATRLTTGKNLPPNPGTDSNGHANGHPNGNRHEKVGINTISLPPPSSPSPKQPSSPIPSSPAKSFSAGSFFQSLRRISLATLAQAAAAPDTSSTHNGGTSNGSLPQSHGSEHHHNGSPVSPVAGKRPPISTTPSYRSGISQEATTGGVSSSGVGSRQEIEALVNQPQSLRCCMTFVNVPWTGIAAMLMDYAYHSNN